MFRRIIIEQWTVIFTIIAFITAASIYLTCVWRTWRMRRPDIARMAELPFTDDPPASRHE